MKGSPKRMTGVKNCHVRYLREKWGPKLHPGNIFSQKCGRGMEEMLSGLRI